MAILTSNPNGGFSLPQTLTQGQPYAGGTVLYDTSTGKPLTAGQTTLSRPLGSTPTYSNLMSNPTANILPPQPTAPTSMSDILMQIFKQAQQSNSNQYTGNNTALLGGKEAIQKTNAGVYSQDLQNSNISNEARLSLLGNDQNLQTPGLTSITDQMNANQAHYNSTNDLVKSTQDAYDREQARALQAKQDLADATYKQQVLAETIRNHKAEESNARAKIGGNGGGGSGGGSVGGGTSSGTSGTISGDVKDILEGRNTMYNIRQTMGRTNKAAAYMEQVRNQIRKVDPNFDFVASDAGGKSVSSTYVQKATAAINSVLPNIQKITDLSNQVSRIGITGVDGLIQKAGLVLNNKKVSNFHEAQKLIADEIGVALGAGTVSDMKLQLGFDVTNPNVSAEVFASNMEVVKEFLNNRKAGLNSLRYSSSTSQNSAPSGGTTGRTSSGINYTIH